ncbi:hypothetical protein [Streptomyces sp. NPDC001851]|uniref:hypothetical protein n=1 Tax=Streptomyces sp. NPDC001851 TaxID=3154529 RepID=UPI003325087F
MGAPFGEITATPIAAVPVTTAASSTAAPVITASCHQPQSRAILRLYQVLPVKVGFTTHS